MLRSIMDRLSSRKCRKACRRDAQRRSDGVRHYRRGRRSAP